MSALHPDIEELFEDQARREEELPGARGLIVEFVAAALLAGAVLAMTTLFPGGSFASPVVLGVLVLAYALACAVRFDFGLGYTSPVQLIAIPMWFAVPPAFLPVAIAAGLVLHKAGELAVLGRRRHPVGLVLTIPDAWHAVGPALVLGTAGAVDPTFADWPIYVAALSAQVLVDAVVSTARGWAELGVAPELQLRAMGWVFAVDAALAPVGLLAAVAMAQTPAALVCLFPLVGLLAVFARERDQRIRQALQLSGAYRGTAILLGDVLEADDAYTGGEHTQGVVELGLAVGRELGLDAQALRDLEFGSLLHDIGKLRVSNEIINKPGKLTEAEWEIIRRHPVDGQEMLSRVGGALEKVGEIVRAHHERVDGGGYPDGLEGDAIPMEARIICVCDSYSAMTTTRSYRRAMSRVDAFEELRRCSGQQFDARVVEALIRIVERTPDTGVPHLRVAAG
ncbi:HD-GYP domain-containing protein [Svornostia abyssi]|uniref:HD-GYP domain-containing protein n=1 Tax=Svornostia abyssi TaxID=2898438 RepID=A0ABY5PPG8_9ACTN|nr:HD-GYP domain-containing protein [Parviterribacteraceae bacterium J379]